MKQGHIWNDYVSILCSLLINRLPSVITLGIVGHKIESKI